MRGDAPQCTNDCGERDSIRDSMILAICDIDKMSKCKLCGNSGNVVYGLPGQSPEYHGKCKPTKDYINVQIKRCEFMGCNITAGFGYEHGKHIYCNTHKLEGMFNTHITCKHTGCKKYPTYGEVGKPRHYCKDHATESMVKRSNRECAYTGCTKCPTYGLPESRYTHCKEHASPDMVSYKLNICKHEGCNKCSMYNLPGQPRKYCKAHSQPGMVNITVRKSPNKSRRKLLCIAPNCTTTRNYNFVGLPSRYCGYHKLDGMVQSHRAICKHDNCASIANYGTNNSREYCYRHKLSNMTKYEYKGN